VRTIAQNAATESGQGTPRFRRLGRWPGQGRGRRRLGSSGLVAYFRSEASFQGGVSLPGRGIPSRAPSRAGPSSGRGRYRWVPLPGHEEAPPRSLSLLVIAGAPEAMAHSHWPARDVEARLPRPVPLGAAGPSGGRLCVEWRGINASSAREGTAAPSRDSCTFPRASTFLRAFTFPWRVCSNVAFQMER
jgi:hypothetical protein